MQKELKIDPELRDLLPPLTEEEYKQLEENIVENGFDRHFPIMEWHGFIADGHNRYDICRKHNIEYTVGTLAYETKEDVMEWMLDIQLGRRNLSPIQRISIAEKYRPIYEKQAKENQGARNDLQPNFSANLQKSSNTQERGLITNKKLSNIAGVSERTYSMGAKILNSKDEDTKQAVLSGEMSINAGYNKIRDREKKKSENHKTHSPAIQIIKSDKPTISEEVKQICADLKTEKSQEYRESIWDYKIDIIECMNAGFDRFFSGFVSILEDMECRVTQQELDICIDNAENLIEKMTKAVETAKNTNLKMED